MPGELSGKAAIVGIGAVSPVGLTAEEHVFFARAGLMTHPPSPFVLADDRPFA